MKIMKFQFLLVFLIAGFLYCEVRAGAQSPQTTGQSTKARSQDSQSKQGTASEGEKRFEAHCGRCHTPPEDLSPREARAVVRQMRVRALISAEDEREILKYIAP